MPRSGNPPRGRYECGAGSAGCLPASGAARQRAHRSEEHTSELQSPCNLVCRLLLEKKRCVVGATTSATEPPDGSAPRSTPISTNASRALPAPSTDSKAATGLFFFNDTATTEIYSLSLHDALPI